MPTFVAFLPGFMGSVLKNERGETVWPPGGSLATLGTKIFKNRLMGGVSLLDELRPTNYLEPTEVVQAKIRVGPFGVWDYGGDFITYLKSICDGETTYIECPYDWRQEMRTMAKQVVQKLDEVVSRHEDARIVIVSHSMGGLVARYALENYPHILKRVTDVFLLGTPNFGSVKAFESLINGWDGGGTALTDILFRVAFKAGYDDLRTLLQDMPSVYSLLPWPDQEQVPVLSVGQRKINIWRDTSWLTREDSQGLLAAHSPPPLNWKSASGYQGGNPDLRMYSIYSESHETPVYYVQRQRGSGRWTDLQPFSDKFGGDGTVLSSSAILPGSEQQYSSEMHDKLFRDGSVQDFIQQRICRRERVGPSDFGGPPTSTFVVSAQNEAAVGGQSITVTFSEHGPEGLTQPWPVDHVVYVPPGSSEPVELISYGGSSGLQNYSRQVQLPDLDGIVELGALAPGGTLRSVWVTLISKASFLEVYEFIRRDLRVFLGFRPYAPISWLQEEQGFGDELRALGPFSQRTWGRFRRRIRVAYEPERHGQRYTKDWSDDQAMRQWWEDKSATKVEELYVQEHK